MTSQRADYYGELQANATLFGLTEKIDVAPLKADELALVLREPARVLGVGFESDDLVSHMVKSAEGQPARCHCWPISLPTCGSACAARRRDAARVGSPRDHPGRHGTVGARRQIPCEVSDKVEAVKRLFTLRLAHVPRQGSGRARWERAPKQRTRASCKFGVGAG